jgi:hypothetical protein
MGMLFLGDTIAGLSIILTGTKEHAALDMSGITIPEGVDAIPID